MSKRSKRQAVKEHFESIAQSRAQSSRDRSAKAAKSLFDTQAALKRARTSNVREMLEQTASKAAVRFWPDRQDEHRSALLNFAEEVHDISPKLALAHLPALAVICKMPLIRDVKSWKPTGKGRDALLRSLCGHLFAKYPMPAFLWTAFTEDSQVARELAPVVVRVAAGESFYKLVKDGELTFPLTKKQCHALLKTPAELSFLAGVRRVQIQVHNGSQRLFQVWRRSNPAGVIGTVRDEAFWDSVMAFFAKNPMLDLAQAGPIIDYLGHRFEAEREFSMKGRTPEAVIRGMEEWHVETYKAPAGDQIFERSGFKATEYARKFRKQGNYLIETWRVVEILSSKELSKEGRAHRHCVGSYSRSISSGRTSIWSLSCDGERRITIEVTNSNKRVIQARGKFNRHPDAQEFKQLKKWADENDLQLSLGGMW